MAYVSQELKKKLAPTIKAICKKYGVKASLAVRNYSTLELNIKEGSVNFFESFNRIGEQTSRHDYNRFEAFRPAERYISVNPYHYKKQFDGIALEFLAEVIPAMNNGNWDNSDILTDYFDVGWYINVNVGRWNKPYMIV